MRHDVKSCMLRESAFSLVELLVVMFIISILLGMLMPALQHARESANRTVCGNNLHNMSIASLEKAPPDSIGGWSVALLSSLEEKNALADFKRHPSLKEGEISSFAYTRPGIMTCPSAYNEKSDIPPIPVTHYVLSVISSDEEGSSYTIGDAPLGWTVPWCVGPEMPPNYWTKNKGPHDGGFLIMHGGAVEYKRWN